MANTRGCSHPLRPPPGGLASPLWAPCPNPHHRCLSCRAGESASPMGTRSSANPPCPRGLFFSAPALRESPAFAWGTLGSGCPGPPPHSCSSNLRLKPVFAAFTWSPASFLSYPLVLRTQSSCPPAWSMPRRGWASGWAELLGPAGQGQARGGGSPSPRPPAPVCSPQTLRTPPSLHSHRTVSACHSTFCSHVCFLLSSHRVCFTWKFLLPDRRVSL